MRNLLLACIGLLVVSGIVSVNLWRELRTERTLTAELRSQLEGAATRQGQPTLPTAGGTSLQSGLVQPPAAAVTGAGDSKTAEAPALPAPNVANVVNAAFNTRELMKDPEYRKARLAQTRMTMPQNYPGLVEELGLSREEADRLFDLLAENQVEMMSISMPVVTNGQVDSAAMAEMTRLRVEVQDKHDESVASMLGSRYGQWQEYQQTRPARQQVMNLNRTLESVGLAMTDAQRKPLTAVYVAEQKRQREESQAMARELSAGGALNQQRMMEESLRRQAESNRRVLEAAAPHLSADQLDALRENFEQQAAMQRASSRILREQGQAQVGAGVAQGVVVVGP